MLVAAHIINHCGPQCAASCLLPALRWDPHCTPLPGPFIVNAVDDALAGTITAVLPRAQVNGLSTMTHWDAAHHEEVAGRRAQCQGCQVHVQRLLQQHSVLVSGRKVMHPGRAERTAVCNEPHLHHQDTHPSQNCSSTSQAQDLRQPWAVLSQPWADLTACQCNMYMSPKCASRQPVETSMFKQPPPAILLPTWVRSRVTGSCLYTWQPPMGKVRLKLMREPSGSRLGWAVVRDPGMPSPYCTCSRQQQFLEAAARALQPSSPLLLVGELQLASQQASLGWSAAAHKPASDTCSTSRSCTPPEAS